MKQTKRRHRRDSLQGKVLKRWYDGRVDLSSSTFSILSYKEVFGQISFNTFVSFQAGQNQIARKELLGCHFKAFDVDLLACAVHLKLILCFGFQENLPET